MMIRIYNYNTLERVDQFDAHSDFIRAVCSHPTHPYLLSCSGRFYVGEYGGGIDV